MPSDNSCHHWFLRVCNKGTVVSCPIATQTYLKMLKTLKTVDICGRINNALLRIHFCVSEEILNERCHKRRRLD